MRPRPPAVLLGLAALVALLSFAPTATAKPYGSAGDPLALLALQRAALTASDGAAGDYFGRSVALSGDTALVGVRERKVGDNTSQGAAYVYVRAGGTWSQQAALTASDGAAGDFFGSSVALSGDTALVGAPYRTVGANTSQGAAYVYVRAAGTWSEQTTLTASDGAAYDDFGGSAALSGDTALVGASSRKVGTGTRQGAAYVYVRSGGTWSEQAPLTASDGAAGDHFGGSAALSDDTALVGASDHTVGSNRCQGAAYVFTRSAGSWSQQAELTGNDGAADDEFGYSVALSGDTALVGAPDHAVGANTRQGAAYVFKRSAGSWSQQGGALTLGDGAASDHFGSSVALSSDTALVGVPYRAVGGSVCRGAACFFTRSAGSWSREATVSLSDGAASEYFGYSVALSGDTALVGAPYRTVGAHTCQGAVYVFVPQLDTTGPTTVGMAASGRKGHAITLKYRVNDNLSPQATAVKLAVRNARGKVVKRFVLGTKKTATWYGIKWTPTSRGTYRYRITAKDLAGNAQVKVGGGKVSVR